jgi:hypothetical protein
METATHTKQERLIEALKAKFPGIKGIKPMGEWSGDETSTSVHLGNAAEGGTIGEHPACNYYGWEWDPTEQIWQMGIQHELNEVLEEHGYFAEWYDAGTVIACEV